MGNQQAQLADNYRHNSHVPEHNKEEPLESYIKEKQRDEHLKNLGFKRSKSLRKSISKRLKRKKKGRDETDTASNAEQTQQQPPEAGAAAPTKQEDPNSIETVKTTTEVKEDATKSKKTEKPAAATERLDVYPEPQRRPRPLVGEPQPLPSHVQVGNALIA